MFYLHEQEIAALLAKGRSNLKIFSVFISHITEQQLDGKTRSKDEECKYIYKLKPRFFSTEVIVHETGRMGSVLTCEGQNLQKYQII